MKVAATLSLLPLASLGRAWVLPTSLDGEQQEVLNQGSLTNTHDDAEHHHVSWWDSIPSKDHISSSIEEVADALTETFDDAVDALEDVRSQLKEQLSEAAEALEKEGDGIVSILNGGGHHGGGRHGRHGRHGKHDFPNLTVYQLINLSNYTKKFAKLVDKFPAVVDLLNKTSADEDITLFVPVDAAFEDIPEDHDKPSDEFIEDLLFYHIGMGTYRAKRILGTHTLPTALEEDFLGGESQRLRTSVGFGGVKVNFYSKVIAADIGAKNGVIHAVRNILVPPPFAGKELTLFPQYFSSLLLAMEKTDFVKYVHGIKQVGSTTFAPTNSAFAWLGPRANAFLFNTDKGKKYLRALLKYHVSPNATLYTDEYYDKTGSDDGDDDGEANAAVGREHYELPTLLGDKRISVDIGRFGGFANVRINGFAGLSVRDVVAKNGVVQVVNRVLIPAHKGHHADENVDEFADGISVEDLIERLADYVEDDDEGSMEL